MKHSGDKSNCGRFVRVLLRKLYQKLKCSCGSTDGEGMRRRGRDEETQKERRCLFGRCAQMKFGDNTDSENGGQTIRLLKITLFWRE